MERQALFARWMNGAVMLVSASWMVGGIASGSGFPAIATMSLLVFGVTFRAFWDRPTRMWRRTAVGSNTAYAFLSSMYLGGLIVWRSRATGPVENFELRLVLAALAIAAAAFNAWMLMRVLVETRGPEEPEEGPGEGL